MAFWDIFSGNPGRETAIWGANNQAAGLQQQQGYINTGATSATGAVNKGATGSLAALNNAATQGLGAIDSGTALSLDALRGGVDQARGDINAQYGAGMGDLQYGRDYAAGALNRNPEWLQETMNASMGYLEPLSEIANRGYSAYADAAGANGVGGQDRARQNFRTGPGYEFTVNEATNAAARAANATGMAASGNTLDATTRLGANLADKEWDDYMAHLSTYNQLAPSITGQKVGVMQHYGDQLAANNVALAGVYSGYGKDAAALHMGQGNTLASLASGLGTNMSNVLSAQGKDRANIYTGQGTGLANTLTNQGTNLANIYSNQGTNLANVTGQNTAATTNLGTAGAMAGQQANSNVWNAGMQVANLAVDAATGKFKNPFG